MFLQGKLYSRIAIVAAASVLPMLAHAQDEAGGRVVLVLPFDNRSGQQNLGWIGESFANTLNARLSSAGFLVISRDDRIYALDHLGLPEGFRPSRATTIRIAQTLDAQFVVVGSYNVKDGNVTAEAQVLAVNKLSMTQPLQQGAALQRLLDVENNLAWLVARTMDPKFSVSQTTFEAASANLKLDAYESYIRGLTSPTPEERLSRLMTAVQLAPDNAEALLALGKLQYTNGDYASAAATLAKVPANDPLALEAGFYRGVASFNNGRYNDAEAAFATVATKLPLPEVVNNQGVSIARQRKDGAALLERASQLDPQDADYHFNVAVTLRRKGQNTRAKTEIDQAVKLRTNDGAAKQLQGILNGTLQPPPGYDPQERIRRTYSEAAFRQAAFQLDQMRAARLATLPADQQATAFTQAGQDYLNRGLALEAEREFQSALTAQPNSPEAHLGLALVRERSGNPDDARKEAHASITAKPGAAAYLVLARLDISSNNNTAAATDVESALQLEPKNQAALNLKSLLISRGATVR